MALKRVRHETCIEYLARRLSEGWKCISFKHPFAILLSPEGIIRPLDLRNDVETLRPNAPGDATNWLPHPSGEANWKNVDEAVADDVTTYNHSGVVEYGSGEFYISIKENGIITNSPLKSPTSSWGNYFHQWITRPSDSGPWTWDDVDALQIGYEARHDGRDLFNLRANS
ncbi:unnamed protein product, partial [marine sediment metagenome]